jgi:hypothetical protein
MYLSSEEKGEYHMDIAQLSEDLLYKEIPMAFYVNIKHVMDKEQMFITWDHNGVNVKYLSFTFEGVYVLDVTNMLEDLLDEDILGELHVYNTHDYFSIIYMTIKTMLTIKMHNFINKRYLYSHKLSKLPMILLFNFFYLKNCEKKLNVFSKMYTIFYLLKKYTLPSPKDVGLKSK